MVEEPEAWRSHDATFGGFPDWIPSVCAVDPRASLNLRQSVAGHKDWTPVYINEPQIVFADISARRTLAVSQMQANGVLPGEEDLGFGCNVTVRTMLGEVVTLKLRIVHCCH